ncbi:phage tail protein [Citrobacter freundii]|nr:phage tail protein [Citrobacter freundii]
MCKGAWSYADNKFIADTGCGDIQLAGAVVEVMGTRGAMTIRVTTASSGTGILNAQFTYINHGPEYLPGWHRDLKRSGDDITGDLSLQNLHARGVIKSAGEMQTTSANAYRIVYGDYGVFWHQNGNDLYLMLTNHGDPYGAFNDRRAFVVNLATGKVTMTNGATIYGLKVEGSVGIGTDNALGGSSIVLGDNDTGLKQNGDGILDVYANSAHVFRFINSTLESMKSLKVNGNCIATGEIQSGNGSARLTSDGNVYGSIWGGWLFDYLRNNVGVQDTRYGAQLFYNPGSNGISWTFSAPSGHSLTGINVQDTGSNSADNIGGVYYRPLQKLINGTWYNVVSI